MSDQPEEKPPLSISIRDRRRPRIAPALVDDAEQDVGDAPYKVGYKRPPLGPRFKPGRSGNPKGRPKGSKNWSTIMAEAASRQRTIGVGGQKVRMSGSEAVAEQTVINAIKGCPKARRDFLNEMHRLAGSAPPSPADQAPTAQAPKRQRCRAVG
ncbi:MAG: hypothetical protein K2P70_19180 [Hyphomonadaceae bacterium]|nr:hypothetical protein [Hyphomonadaceae bacterium]